MHVCGWCGRSSHSSERDTVVLCVSRRSAMSLLPDSCCISWICVKARRSSHSVTQDPQQTRDDNKKKHRIFGLVGSRSDLMTRSPTGSSQAQCSHCHIVSSSTSYPLVLAVQDFCSDVSSPAVFTPLLHVFQNYGKSVVKSPPAKGRCDHALPAC